jgi:hypothetical protein
MGEPDSRTRCDFGRMLETFLKETAGSKMTSSSSLEDGLAGEWLICVSTAQLSRLNYYPFKLPSLGLFRRSLSVKNLPG